MRISRYDTTCPYQWPATRGIHLQEHIPALNRDIRIKRLYIIYMITCSNSSNKALTQTEGYEHKMKTQMALTRWTPKTLHKSYTIGEVNVASNKDHESGPSYVGRPRCAARSRLARLAPIIALRCNRRNPSTSGPGCWFPFTERRLRPHRRNSWPTARASNAYLCRTRGKNTNKIECCYEIYRTSLKCRHLNYAIVVRGQHYKSTSSPVMDLKYSTTLCFPSKLQCQL